MQLNPLQIKLFGDKMKDKPLIFDFWNLNTEINFKKFKFRKDYLFYLVVNNDGRYEIVYSNLKEKYPYRENLVPPELPFDIVRGVPVFRYRTSKSSYRPKMGCSRNGRTLPFNVQPFSS